MSETSINPGASEDRVPVPVWRTILNLVIAVLAATLAPLLVCLCAFPIVLVLFYLTYEVIPPGILQDINYIAGGTSYVTVYFGTALTVCMSVQFIIFGFPTALVGWRLGWINLPSSLIAGFLIGCLPWLWLMPFDSTFGSNYSPFYVQILRLAGEGLVLGVLGAFEGFLFWLVWQFLSGRGVPAKRAVGSVESPPLA